MRQNPYTLTFGKEPLEMISREHQISEILNTFSSAHPSSQVFMISGVQGSGKTVFMSEICSKLRKQTDWIITELSPESDMLRSLAAKLYSEEPLAKTFQSARINLSFFGFGINFDGTSPIYDIEAALEKMIQSLKDLRV